MDMDMEVARFFRDQFRNARAVALLDAEGFQEIIFVLERFGAYLIGKIKSLDHYKKDIERVARSSPLADDIPNQYNAWHPRFSTVYELVREARNDALHQGAFARHLTNNAIQLALVMEDALMSNANTVSEFMVREPICALRWQPMSFIRQQMLKNSFTYLPLSSNSNGQSSWQLVSDYHVAHYLRQGDRKACLAKKLDDAIEEGLSLEQAETCFVDTNVIDVLNKSEGKPVIVIDKECPELLIGIVTPFDFL